MKTFRLPAILAIGLLACEFDSSGPASSSETNRPEVLRQGGAGRTNRVKHANSNPLSSSASPSRRERLFEGSVVERLAAGGYTYVAVSDEGVARWVATMGDAPQMGVAVRVEAFAASDDFHSPRLDRDFDRLLFGTVEPASPPTDNG